jgi:hypothetical protein
MTTIRYVISHKTQISPASKRKPENTYWNKFFFYFGKPFQRTSGSKIIVDNISFSTHQIQNCRKVGWPMYTTPTQNAICSVTNVFKSKINSLQFEQDKMGRTRSTEWSYQNRPVLKTFFGRHWDGKIILIRTLEIVCEVIKLARYEDYLQAFVNTVINFQVPQ